MLDEEVNQRKEDHAEEVQERKTHELEMTTVVDEDREVGNDQLSSLREDMVRETEMLR
jgi:hypothetical protein